MTTASAPSSPRRRGGRSPRLSAATGCRRARPSSRRPRRATRRRPPVPSSHKSDHRTRAIMKRRGPRKVAAAPQRLRRVTPRVCPGPRPASVTRLHPAKIPRVPRKTRVRRLPPRVGSCRHACPDQVKRGHADTDRYGPTHMIRSEKRKVPGSTPGSTTSRHRFFTGRKHSGEAVGVIRGVKALAGFTGSQLRRRRPGSLPHRSVEHPLDEMTLQHHVQHDHRQGDDDGSGREQRRALGVLALEERQAERRRPYRAVR